MTWWESVRTLLDSAGKANVIALTLTAVGSLAYGFFIVGRKK